MQDDKPEVIKINTGDCIKVGTIERVRLTILHPYFIEEAKRFLSANEPNVAVVLAQTAVEIISEQVLFTLVTKNFGDGAWDHIQRLLPGHNIVGTDEVRDFYQRLASERLNKLPFWKGLDAHNMRRNGIVHKGHSCTIQEAQESITVVEAYIGHMSKWLTV